jgi:hypothetical protein
VKRVYLNHFFHEKGSKEPVVTVEDKKLVYGNRVDILHKGRVVASVVTGRLTGYAGHDVKAWIETDCELEVR